MSDANLANRIPFEEIESVDVWSFPSWDQSHGAASAEEKERVPQPDATESVETVEEHAPTPITAEQLQKISDEAAQEASEHGYQEGLQKGYTEGYENGVQEGRQQAYQEHKMELEEKIRIFQDLANALNDPVGMQDQALESWIVDTAIHLAKHLINRALTEDLSPLFDIIEKAVSSLPVGAKNIRVYLHPDDVALAVEAFSSSAEQWSFYPDTHLARGGVRVVSNNSLVDYSIESRLQKLLDEVNFQGDVDHPADPIPSYAPQAQGGSPQGEASDQRELEESSTPGDEGDQKEDQTHDDEPGFDAVDEDDDESSQ